MIVCVCMCDGIECIMVFFFDIIVVKFKEIFEIELKVLKDE